MRLFLLSALACSLAAAQTADPARDLLDEAYAALRAGDFAAAEAHFEAAGLEDPLSPAPRRELGYLYLKTNRPGEARAAFGHALKLDPSDAAAARELGYLALDAGELDAAVTAFRQAAANAPDDAAVRVQLAYALLETGETVAARDRFEEAVRLEPENERAALELAFLRYETGRPAEALAGFRALAESENAEIAETAAETRDRVEAELGGGIERWEQAVAADPSNRSAVLELADLLLRRGDAADAAERYAAAFALPGPNREEILLELGRARFSAGDEEGAHGAWLLASRSAETRIAETARDLLPERFPYANEFRAALALDPDKTALRRELGYLLLEVGESEQATQEFETVVERNPDDLQAAAQLAFLYLMEERSDLAVRLLERARASDDPEVAGRAGAALRELREEKARPARRMGEKSLNQSYLLDARRYFTEAWRANPDDLTVALKLGVVNNLLTEDRKAVRWFRLARESEDRAVAAQARRSYNALAPEYKRFRTTFWAFPFYSKRFGTVFGYGQLKTELRASKRLRPYVSVRLAGDVRRTTGGRTPQQLSESSVIGALGLRAPLGNGVTLWGEAGEAVSYLGKDSRTTPLAAPDYRGGFNWFRARGASLGGNEPGRFVEANLDVVYVSRFDHDALAYFQLKPGYRLPNWGPVQAQVYANWNVTTDRSGQWWANYAEAGPGFRLLVPGVKPPMVFSVDWVRGVHLSNKGNPRRPNYFDLRAGVWYSFTK